MGPHPTPRIRRTAQNTQFTYNLSRRINSVQTYPVQSPQGATVLIYGHDKGVTLVWRGGRRFKPQKKKEEPVVEKQNGTAEDAVVIIDLDDDVDQTAAKPQAAPVFEDKPQFEDAAEQSPYPEIVQTLDLTLGTAVLHVAVMPMAPCTSAEASAGDAPLLGERMVFAVSCVTSDVYVISLPLTPPSPESKARPLLRADLMSGKAGSGAWGESLIPLGGQTRHSDGLAMSLLKPSPSEPDGKLARAVVAACSRQASGALLLWDVPLDPQAKPARALEPFQTEFLASPLTSIAFNPTHTTQLLAVSPHQAARVYDFGVSSLPPEPGATGPFPSQGSWLLSLYPPFARPSASRKPILDAVWISHGRAIFVLLADGMWGIWDVDGVSPSSPAAVISSKLKSGVRGAALTAFSVSGYVEGTGTLRSMSAQPKESQPGEFAPMTPHTRRQATASLSTTTADRLSTVRGGIHVTALPSSGRALQDESLVLWVGGQEHVCVVPGVSRFWDSQLRRGSGGGVNLFSGAQPTRMVKLLDLSTGLLGERCCGVGLMADPTDGGDDGDGDGGLPVDVLVQGETRVVVVRQGEEGPGKKIGGVVDGQRRRLFSKGGQKADAIIVRGRDGGKPSFSYNLSTSKPGTLRSKPLFGGDTSASGPAAAAAATTTRERARAGFDFMKTLDDAADASAELTRDVEVEMLDIMEIDQALWSMEGSRSAGRKRVLFEED